MVFYTEDGKSYYTEGHLLHGDDLSEPLPYVSGTGKVFCGMPAQFELQEGGYFTTKYPVCKVLAH